MSLGVVVIVSQFSLYFSYMKKKKPNLTNFIKICKLWLMTITNYNTNLFGGLVKWALGQQDYANEYGFESPFSC